MSLKEPDLKNHFTIGRIEDCSDASNCVRTKEMHSHNHYILYVVKEGTGIHNIDFHNVEIKPGRVLFISRDQMHKFGSEAVSGYYIAFNFDFYHSVRSIFKLYDFPFFHTSLTLPYLDTGNDYPTILNLTDNLYKDFIAPESFGKWSLMRYGLENLLIRLTRIKQKQSPDDAGILIPNNEKLRKLELLIEQNFREHHEIAFYAEQLHLSSRHLNNIISGKAGKSISQMIQERVLTEAKRQLLHSEKTVAEIAFQLGFNDKAYFHRFFKQQMQQTPRAFRKEFLEE